MIFSKELGKWQTKIEAVAKRQGLDFFEIVYDVLNWDSMAEVSSYYGLPDHFSHWKFGESYLNTKKSFSFGLSKIYEMVINTIPSIAYLLEENKLVDQKLVMAHVCAHVDFFKNNLWFEPTDRQMLSSTRSASERIEKYRAEIGESIVDEFITECMKIDNLIDSRLPYIMRSKKDKCKDKPKKGEALFKFKTNLPYLDDFINPPDWIDSQSEKEKDKEKESKEVIKGRKFPARPIRDILLFLLYYAPLEQWQRDILDIIRQESYYFLPQSMTKISNEGWAAYWHSELMVKRRLASSKEIVDYAQHNAGTLGSPGFNPYKIGKMIFKDIEYRWDTGRHGLIWKYCRKYLDRKFDWDDFIIFKNIYEEDKESFLEKWNTWCFFKSVCEEGLFGFPKDLYSKSKLIKWWCEYLNCEYDLIKLKCELESNSDSNLIDEISTDIRWKEKLLTIKIIWNSEISDKSVYNKPIPDIFFTLSKRYPGTVPLGQGRKKIFEVRRRINDLSLIREFFTHSIFDRSPMFSYKAGGGGVSSDHWGIDKTKFDDIKRKLMFNLFNRGEPIIEVVNARYSRSSEYDGVGLYLKHKHEGVDLKIDEMQDTILTIYKIWQNPVYMETIVIDEDKKTNIPPDILKQMGIESVEEKRQRSGMIKVFYTINGTDINNFNNGETTVELPY